MTDNELNEPFALMAEARVETQKEMKAFFEELRV